MQTSCKSGRLKSNLTWGNTKSLNYALMYGALCRMLQLKSERDPDTKKDKGSGIIPHFNGGVIYHSLSESFSPSPYISL